MTVWAQRNVALVRTDGNPLPAAQALFTTLAPLVEAARSTGAFELFFFQRKAPDVRLRFGAVHDASDLDPTSAALAVPLGAIEAALDELVAAGTLERWYPAPYEPEVRKFGGSGAAEACHRHFDADTRLWLATQQLDSRFHAIGDPSAYDLAASTADELFIRVLQDRDEVWDTWANLADIAGDPDPNLPAPHRIPIATSLDVPDGSDRSGILSAIAALAEAHDAYAAAIAAELEAGTLRVGPRAILPFVAQLDLQRWGLGGPQQAAVATAMMTAWDPTTALRGR